MKLKRLGRTTVLLALTPLVMLGSAVKSARMWISEIRDIWEDR